VLSGTLESDTKSISARGGNPEPPIATSARFRQAAEELQIRRLNLKPWEIAMAARRRNVVTELSGAVERLKADGEMEFAREVNQFIQDMPPVESEARKIQSALVKNVEERLERIQKEK
jgi:hypothetical protein